FFFFFSSRRRHTRSDRDWSSDVCSSDLGYFPIILTLLVVAAILLKQPDFGLTVVLCTTIFIMLFIAQFRAKYLFLTAFSAVPIKIGRASCRERVYITVMAEA